MSTAATLIEEVPELRFANVIYTCITTNRTSGRKHVEIRVKSYVGGGMSKRFL
jgi:hypothetical protein